MEIVTKNKILKYANQAAKLNALFLELRLKLSTRFDANYIKLLEQKHMFLQLSVSNTYTTLTESISKGKTSDELFQKIESLLEDYSEFVFVLQTTFPPFKTNSR